MTSYPLTNFKILSIYPIKDGAYVINLNENPNIGTNWVALCLPNNGVTYFYSFGVEHIPKETETFVGNKNIKTNIFRIQA